MSYNKIPSLSASLNSSFNGSVPLSDVELLQVQVVIRHGARVPAGQPNCWEGYDFAWDCNVTEVVISSKSGGGGGSQMSSPFRKVFDAFPSEDGLDGTCHRGQLNAEGYDQEKIAGGHLREAYVCNSSLCLFKDSAAELQASGALYLRSDDQQRTVMSGQLLASSMLNASDVVLDLHTGDFKFDYLKPNPRTCPVLDVLSDTAFNSTEWSERLSSQEVSSTMDDMRGVWGREVDWTVALDCLMTTACTGRELPDGMTEQLFQDAVSFSTEMSSFQYLYDNSSFSKLAMARLTTDMRGFLMGARNGTSPVKFVLISGHDNTLMPLLAAITPEGWDKKWPPYASLMSLELLRISGGGNSSSAGGASEPGVAGDYFRLVYNGRVLRLKGCDKDVCPVDVFLQATSFGEELVDEDACIDLNATVLLSQTPAPVIAPSPVPTTLDTLNVPSEENSTTTESVPETTVDSSGDDPYVANSGQYPSSGSNSFGIAVSCFLIGAMVVAIPGAMYFRRFRYEAMREIGHRYEMT